MKVPQQAVDIVAKWEGLELEAYQDSVGIWTIGYGTTAAAGLGINPRPGMKITEREARMYLQRGLEKFADEIRPYITAPINENEFSAFLSLAYNIGPGAFKRSTALGRFNMGNKKGAADALTWFNKAQGKVLRGLVNRRADEKALFLKPVTPIPPTPYSWLHRLVMWLFGTFTKYRRK